MILKLDLVSSDLKILIDTVSLCLPSKCPYNIPSGSYSFTCKSSRSDRIYRIAVFVLHIKSTHCHMLHNNKGGKVQHVDRSTAGGAALFPLRCFFVPVKHSLLPDQRLSSITVSHTQGDKANLNWEFNLQTAEEISQHCHALGRGCGGKVGPPVC